MAFGMPVSLLAPWGMIDSKTVDLGAPANMIESPEKFASPRNSDVVRRSGDGLFHINGKFGGRTLSFVIDTGSTNVFLSYSDARAIGIVWDESDRSIIKTASGSASVYWIDVPSLEVAGRTITDLRVGIIPGQKSLLGQDALSRLGKITIEQDTLTIGRGSTVTR